MEGIVGGLVVDTFCMADQGEGDWWHFLWTAVVAMMVDW